MLRFVRRAPRIVSLVSRVPRIVPVAAFALLVLSSLGGADPWFF
jgi:hypothetical protein